MEVYIRDISLIFKGSEMEAFKQSSGRSVYFVGLMEGEKTNTQEFMYKIWRNEDKEL